MGSVCLTRGGRGLSSRPYLAQLPVLLWGAARGQLSLFSMCFEHSAADTHITGVEPRVHRVNPDGLVAVRGALVCRGSPPRCDVCFDTRL